MVAVNYQILNFRTLINFLLSLMPVSFIAGNLIINLNITFIIVSCLFYWKKDFFRIRFNLIDKLLTILFVLAIISSLLNLNNFLEYDNVLARENFIKAIAFSRYFLFYISLRLIVEKSLLNFKVFFLTASVCVIFVSLDLMLQFFRGTDIFGFPKTPYKLSGPFGDEQIAGSYLQRFCLFLFFLFPLLKNNLDKRLFYLIISPCNSSIF